MENWQSITRTSEAAFTPGATGWFVAGILGGTLNGSGEVTINPSRELTRLVRELGVGPCLFR